MLESVLALRDIRKDRLCMSGHSLVVFRKGTVVKIKHPVDTCLGESFIDDWVVDEAGRLLHIEKLGLFELTEKREVDICDYYRQRFFPAISSLVKFHGDIPVYNIASAKLKEGEENTKVTPASSMDIIRFVASRRIIDIKNTFPLALIRWDGRVLVMDYILERELIIDKDADEVWKQENRARIGEMKRYRDDQSC